MAGLTNKCQGKVPPSTLTMHFHVSYSWNICPNSPSGPETNLSSLLLELLDGSLVDASALVDQVAGGCGLAGVDMANDHDVDVDLFLSHFG